MMRTCTDCLVVVAVVMVLATALVQAQTQGILAVGGIATAFGLIGLLMRTQDTQGRKAGTACGHAAASPPHEPRKDAAWTATVSTSPERSAMTTRRHLRAGWTPRVRVRSEVIERLVAGINGSRRKHGDVEVGFALVGKTAGRGATRELLITGLIDEGPRAGRSLGHHRADREYQQKELELMQLVDGDVMYLGDAHLHPGYMDTCSLGDWETDSANTRESVTKELVFIIATAPRYLLDWGDQDNADCIRRDGLKLSFYYMGRDSEYEYRRFTPVIEEGPAVDTPDALRRFAGRNPERARLDFDNLRRLSAYRRTVSGVSADGVERTRVEMHHRTRGFRTVIEFDPDPAVRPDVFVAMDGDVMRYEPESLGGGWSDLIWLTPLVLDVERAIEERHRAAVLDVAAEPAAARPAAALAELNGPDTEMPPWVSSSH